MIVGPNFIYDQVLDYVEFEQRNLEIENMIFIVGREYFFLFL